MRAFALLLLLSACGEIPPVMGSISSASQGQPFPQLIPLDTLLAQANTPSRAAAAQSALTARAAGITRAIPAPAAGNLTDRARRLRERAAALRAVAI